MTKHYDPKKNRKNITKHDGVSFDDVANFEWETAVTKLDTRFDYGEKRYISYGMLHGRLHVLVWTPRSGQVRPISFRKANSRERKRYDNEKA